MLNKLPPRESDVAIVCEYCGLNVYFAQIPDRDVVQDLYSITENRSFIIDEAIQEDWSAESEQAVTTTLDRQRLSYWIDISPIYEPIKVARAMARSFSDDHGMSVRIISDDETDRPYVNAQVFSPKR